VYYKNNYYQNHGKSGYLNQNPQKIYGSAITNMGIPGEKFNKTKNYQNIHIPENQEHINEANKGNILNAKRKNMSEIEDYDSFSLKKIKSENCNQKT